MLITKSIRVNNILIRRITNIRSLASCRKYSDLNEQRFQGKYDVIITGGGMVGCTLACAMGMYGF